MARTIVNLNTRAGIVRAMPVNEDREAEAVFLRNESVGKEMGWSNLPPPACWFITHV
ncbi:hypothetical protein BXY66_1802 [Shimia isoporae]|uniref:Uncharacterized protein n=1 Tax=Shimia isoporae TaxID=647720 RepID=A0A4R1NNI0_9RHOB|nr:hypothetical protein [Shimia isoporae]TCL09745.1 hypothetical protein BXY66_1802 [Shimia isoporae]